MAQIKNNQVKGLLKPSFQTKTTTPQIRGVVDMNAAMRGVSPGTPFNQSMIPGPQTKLPSKAAQTGVSLPSYGALGVMPTFGNLQSKQPVAQNNTTPNNSPSFPQTGQTVAPAVSPVQGQNTTQTSTSQQKTDAAKPSVQPQGFFPGVLNQLLGASKPTKEQERARKEMERISAGNKAIADEAKRISDMYGAEIGRVGQLGAGAVAGNLSTGTSVVGSGNAAIASQSASTRMDALAKAQQAALEGTAQQLTGQEQAAQAFKPSLEASLTQQQQQLSGLGTTAGLAAPVQVQPGSTLFAPVGGEEIAGGLGGWANYTTAQQVQSLIEQYPDAGVVYNPNLTPQQNAQIIQQAIAGSPSYQRGTYGQAGASNPQQAADISLGQQGYTQFSLQTEQLRQTVSTAQSLGQNLALVMEQFSINGQPLRTVNIPFNTLKKQYSPEMTAFQTALRETANAYNQVFATTGTTPTDAQAISEAIFNENSTPQQMIAALEQLEEQAKKKVEIAEKAPSAFYGLLPSQGGGGGIFDF